ncbi:Protein CBG21992, partial [Caenorhabditis briggsae]
VDLNETNVRTHRGYVPLNKVNEEVFKKFSYEIIEASIPVPTLRMTKEPSCADVFAEYLIKTSASHPVVPPKIFQKVYTDLFLLNGYAAFDEWYFNDQPIKRDAPRNWSRITEYMTYTKQELGELAYKKESESMYHAMNGYRLDGKTGIVVGSMQPWLEVMAFQNGASKILTVEHYKLDIPDQFRDILTDIRPMDLATSWKKYAGSFDFAASFSIIHHFGLGRFGDPLDAIGDLREMRKIQCLLKQGGILYLAVPIGTDALQFNVQRIYGAIRLAMMFVGYEWVATYSHESRDPITLSSEVLHKPLFISQHYTLVLRKM